MSRRGERGGSRTPARRRGRGVARLLVALALLLAGAGVGAVAVIFGLVPGFRVRSPFERLPDATATRDSVPAPPALPAADSARAAAGAEGTAAPGMVAGLAPGENAVTPADSADGELVYRGAGRCLSCHGAAGEGVPGLGPDLRDARWIVGDGSVAAIARAVREGISPPREFPVAMPAYAGQIADDAIARVARYVYALSHPGAVRDSLAPPDSARFPDPTR